MLSKFLLVRIAAIVEFTFCNHYNMDTNYGKESPKAQ